MPVTLNHLAIPARDPEATASFLAQLLELRVERDGREDEFPCLRLANGVQILFQVTAEPEPCHVAFQASELELRRVIERLRAASIAFGNDPEGPPNGDSSDPLGGIGRVYFKDR